MGEVLIVCDKCGKESKIHLVSEFEFRELSEIKCPECGSDDIFYRDIKFDYHRSGQIHLGEHKNSFYLPW